MAQTVDICAAVQTPYVRHPADDMTTASVLANAARSALVASTLTAREIDGLGIASFTLAPDRAIDMSVKLGLRATWIMDSGLGGASGVDMLQHAVAAIRNGDARRILLVGGDAFTPESFNQLVRNYNVATGQDYGDVPGFGPNAMFALITQQQMTQYGLEREDYGFVAIRQRKWASRNPNAVYRHPLSMTEYLEAPLVADPLTILDCVPVVAGACAVIVEAERTESTSGRIVVRGIAADHNADLHTGTGLTTGLTSVCPRLWNSTGWSPAQIDVLSLYDDYPAVVVAQLIDAGFLRAEHVRADLRALLSSEVALNSSGGMLSAGQCGAGAGLHFIVDAVKALQTRSIGAKALVSGYGMVVSRYGACSNAAALERVS